jgi:hypothetical protein
MHETEKLLNPVKAGFSTLSLLTLKQRNTYTHVHTEKERERERE